ncbi:hypothetical protein BKE30_02270 [Alkanindiges hydrocarboniclasticus]|jgi:hypothetical protein|uniref:Uncharacterized protein n=1 Tax=Alkanindiges hydrocarboniclasticus TaxID=1907941 RepID=A0A1S8CX56_9GAMM|nr:Imm44 family immunity protein [Alkanindiges hydrocarboniclasticus]ONG41929.1 hypothetical protein BKE30_02270 [Alkanindiges hydrocarboniclasticus]
MKVWLSSESSKEVLNEDQLSQLRLARNYVETILKGELESKSYNIPLDSWDCITIMMGENSFDERIIYSVKKRNMDFRLKINYVAFNTTDDLGRQQLIFSMLMRSLDLLKEKFKKVKPKLSVEVYNELERMRADTLKVAKTNNWV